ncbi:CAAX protease [Pontibacillus chungwhensis BH030062]|uniref:CAAX protease n=1 Tax=Pontibacillus chungwhensis BH030062 TaxID=1385513 RepID=A0A0A2UQW6_9BACI|nr:type II CAAX endopeptidase family protein [Pontibacillus chungwhensis]KGP90324.1 CAAX protease [Pontibacillus chungwhensis BH030062]
MKGKFHGQVRWTYRELMVALFIAFILVPILVEGFLKDLLYDWLGNELYSGTLTGFAMAIIFMTSVYFIALRPFGYSWKCVGVQLFSREYGKWIILWTLIYIVASVLIIVGLDLLAVGVDNQKTESLTMNVTWLTFTIGFISAAVISPIYEEIFYRGFLYKWFRLKWGVSMSLVVSSVIFMLVHIPTYNTLPITFIGGLIFAWAYEKSGSVVPSMIIHGAFNGIAVTLTAFAS